jgi:hypothetical protein
MTQVSNITKLRFALRVVQDLKDLDLQNFYFQDGNWGGKGKDSLELMIAKRAGVRIEWNGQQAGLVDISEYISLTMDEYIHREYKRLSGGSIGLRGGHNIYEPKFKVSDELKALTKKFEEDNIPKSGPCKTEIGEMFRAIQRIQYRAFNDGDSWYVIGSPSFMSYMFLLSKIDELNYSSASYNNETGQHSFEFTDEFLIQNSWDGRISNYIECSLAQDAEFIKYQLIDLLSNGKIKDVTNLFDSRDYSKIKKGYNY